MENKTVKYAYDPPIYTDEENKYIEWLLRRRMNQIRKDVFWLIICIAILILVIRYAHNIIYNWN